MILHKKKKLDLTIILFTYIVFYLFIHALIILCKTDATYHLVPIHYIDKSQFYPKNILLSNICFDLHLVKSLKCILFYISSLQKLSYTMILRLPRSYVTCNIQDIWLVCSKANSIKNQTIYFEFTQQRFKDIAIRKTKIGAGLY